MDPEGKPRPRRPVEGSLPALMFGFIAIAAVGLAARRWLPALSGDGKKFLAVVPETAADEQPLTVVVNWTEGIPKD